MAPARHRLGYGADSCAPPETRREITDQGAEPVRQDHAGRPAGGYGTRRAAGELEAAALAVLQAAGSALTPGQVRDRLGEQPGGRLAYSTVVTILSRLYAKGVLTRSRSGRAYSYAPVADEPGLAARRMRSVLEAEPDREAVLARFVSGMSPADEQLLRRMLAEQPGAED
jgi:predicted transcriptional regulator